MAELRGWIESRDGAYRARLRFPEGANGPSKTFTLKREARAWLDEQLADFHRGEFIDSKLGKLTFAEWSERWTASTVNLRRNTRDRHRLELAKWMMPTFATRPIGAIKQFEIQAWVTAMHQQGCNASSIEARLITLRSCLQAAVDAELIHKNPCTKVKLPQKTDRKARFLTISEIHRLADEIGPKYRALVWLAATGGLRIGELAGLELKHVDLFRSRVTVEQQMTYVSGRALIEPVKSSHGNRQIAVPRATAKELQEHLKVNGTSQNGLMFTGPRGDWLHTNSFRENTFRPAAKRAGLEPLVPHDLRHTAVSLWIATGANAKEIQRMAGHASIRVTFDTYGHLLDDHDDAIALKLDELVSSQPKRARLKVVE